jgi:hypothetical protein
MILTMADLDGQLKGYYQQLEKHQVCVNQCSGAIQAIEHQMKMMKEASAKMEAELQLQLEKDRQNAIEAGEVTENNTIEHQDGNQCGQETKPSSSDSLQQGGEV